MGLGRLDMGRQGLLITTFSPTFDFFLLSQLKKLLARLSKKKGVHLVVY